MGVCLLHLCLWEFRFWGWFFMSLLRSFDGSDEWILWIFLVNGETENCIKGSLEGVGFDRVEGVCFLLL